MIRSLPILALILGLLVATPSANAQDLTPDELFDGMKSFLKKDSDTQVIGIIDIITQRFPEFTEREQKNAIKAIQRCFSARREEGDNQLYVAAVNAFAKMGEMGEKPTLKAMNHRTVESRPEVLAAAIVSLGTHANVKYIDTIVKYLVSKDAVVIAAAAESLGNGYVDQPEKVRKEIVEALVKNYSNYYNLVQANRKEPIYEDRLRIIERPMQTALQQLTGQSLKEAPEWQRWYNNNKRKRWDEEEG